MVLVALFPVAHKFVSFLAVDGISARSLNCRHLFVLFAVRGNLI